MMKRVALLIASLAVASASQFSGKVSQSVVRKEGESLGREGS